MKVVYIAIGNSDDSLSQKNWSEFVRAVHNLLPPFVEQTVFAGFSLPSAPYQNAIWCVVTKPDYEIILKRRLKKLAEIYKQEAISWAVAPTTELLGPGSVLPLDTEETPKTSVLLMKEAGTKDPQIPTENYRG